MNVAVATLQQAARRLQLSGELDPSKYAWMISQLRGVTVELDASERRARRKSSAAANFTELLRDAAAPFVNRRIDNLIAVQLPEAVMVEGPAQEIRDLLGCLFEYAGACPGPVDLRAEFMREPDSDRETVSVELSVRSPEIPDFIRRKLWDVARPRHGQISIVAEPDRCRIGLILPTERRR